MAVLLQARSGIARAGAERAGYYTYNLVVVINGTDRTTSVIQDALSVSLTINNEPDTARLTLKPDGTTIPIAGQSVVIGLGGASARIFAGQIQRMRRRYVGGRTSPFVECDCIDYTRLFNRRLVLGRWQNVSATQIANEIVDVWTSGFTRASVAPGLATIDDFSVTYETPTAALLRLAALIDGAFYLDEWGDVHLFTRAAGDVAPRAGTAPATLTLTLGSLKEADDFIYETDVSQQRTRTIVEGQRTTSLIATPSGVSITTLPVQDTSQLGSATTVRIGTAVLSLSAIVGVASLGDNPPGSTLSSAVAAGATSLPVADVSQFTNSHGWVNVGGQIVYWDAKSGSALESVPASGYGSLAAAISSGTAVTAVGHIAFSSSVLLDPAAPVSSDVVQHVTVNDTSAQTSTAATEGGDGIHEVSITDGRLGTTGMTTAGTADLTSFAGAVTAAAWTTEDLRARPGRQQAIAIADISTTLIITNTEITIPVQNRTPKRRCEAANVHTAALLDAIVTD